MRAAFHGCSSCAITRDRIVASPFYHNHHRFFVFFRAHVSFRFLAVGVRSIVEMSSEFSSERSFRLWIDLPSAHDESPLHRCSCHLDQLKCTGSNRQDGRGLSHPYDRRSNDSFCSISGDECFSIQHGCLHRHRQQEHQCHHNT